MIFASSCENSRGGDSGGILFEDTNQYSNSFVINLPANKTYDQSENIDISLIHDAAIAVSGVPRIALTIGSDIVYTDYFAGSGTSNIVFRYDIQPTDQDLDGLEISSSIDLNGGTLRFAQQGVLYDANTSLPSVDTSGILVSSQVVSQLVITNGPSNTSENTTINPAVTVEFRDASNNLVNTTDNMTVTISANPASGSLTGTTTVAAVNGVATFNNLQINNYGSGYTLAFSAGALSVTSSSFDILNGAPTVSITSAGTILDANKSAYTVSGNCSENTFAVSVDIGSLNYTPTCTGGSFSTGIVDVSTLPEGTTTITANHNDGTNNAVPASVNVEKDTDVPDVNSNTIVAATYNLGDTITLELVFDQIVNVTGNPRVELTLNSQSSNPLYATFSGGSGSTTLSFTHNVAAGDADPDGIVVDNLIELAGGTILDANGNPANPAIVTTSFPSAIVDSAVPSITSFVEPVNATYPDGVGLLFQVNFDEAVNITGVPRISIDLGGSTVYADYKTGTGSAGLEFEYIIQPGDGDPNGITLNSTSIELNGGTIKGLDGDDAVLGFSLHLDSMAGVIVDTASGITPPDQVTGLTAAPTTNNTTLALSWGTPNDNGTAIVNYSVQYRQQGSSTWLNSSPNPTANSTNVTGLTSGITYEFRVAANNGLLGAYSAVATAEIFDVLSLNPIAWLDATNITNGGTEPSHGDRIAAWSDLTGVASDAVESNVSNQPIYHTNVKNGLPAVRFDGTQDRGLQGSYTRVNNGGLTIILVGSMDTNTNRRCFFEFFQDGSPSSGASSRRGFMFTYGFGNATTNFFLDDSDFNVWTAYDTGTNSTQWENGTNIYTNRANHFGNTAFTGLGHYILGDDMTGGDRLSGYIAEFLIFDRQLTASEISTLETYLKNKWGTP